MGRVEEQASVRCRASLVGSLVTGRPNAVYAVAWVVACQCETFLWLWAAAGANKSGLEMTPADVHLSYLPLAHVFERVVQAALFAGGSSIGFYQGNTLKIVDDLKALRPTIFPSVPR